MAALNLDMTVPLGDGHAHIIVIADDISALDDDDRAFLDGIVTRFFAVAGRTLAPPALAAVRPPAAVHDPSASVLAGVTGTRRNTS